MNRLMRLAVCIPLSLFAHSAAAEQLRSLHAHEHGVGSLGIAVSGSELAISLEVPGADIVGFEHSAKSAEDRAAVKTALSDLEQPLTLFVFPEGASCSVKSAKATLFGDDMDEAEHDDHAHHEEEKHSNDKHDHDHDEEQHAEEGETGGHTEFRAEYSLNCERLQNIDAIQFAYFKRFSGARELGVQIVSNKGSSAHEVVREKPVLALKGML